MPNIERYFRALNEAMAVKPQRSSGPQKRKYNTRFEEAKRIRIEHKYALMPPYIDLNKVLDDCQIEDTIADINSRYYNSTGIVLRNRTQKITERCWNSPNSRHGHRDEFGWTGPAIFLFIPVENSQIKLYKCIQIAVANQGQQPATDTSHKPRKPDYKKHPRTALTLQIKIGNSLGQTVNLSSDETNRQPNEGDFDIVALAIAKSFINLQGSTPIRDSKLDWVPPDIRPAAKKFLGFPEDPLPVVVTFDNLTESSRKLLQ